MPSGTYSFTYPSVTSSKTFAWMSGIDPASFHATVKFVSDLLEVKAISPISATLFGRVMLGSTWKLVKAFFPILVTPSPRVRVCAIPPKAHQGCSFGSL